MSHLVAAAVFLFFVGLVGASWMGERHGWSEVTRRRVATVAIAWAAAATLAAGATRKSAWPFASWVLMPNTTGEEVAIDRLLAVDATGGRHPIDHRAWAPLSEEELHAWLRGPFLDLAPADREAVLEDLLGRAESARERASAGSDPSPAPGLLGPVAASTHILHPDRWSDASRVPRQRFVGIELVSERWNVLARRDGDPSVERVVLQAHRADE